MSRIDGTSVDTIPQAGAVPVRRSGKNWEICLITSSGRGRWTLPKGHIDSRETVEDAAVKECWEEAGLEGIVTGDSIGWCDYLKLDVALRVEFFVIKVTRIAKKWPECGIRKRRWLAAENALQALDRIEQRPIIESTIEMLAAQNVDADWTVFDK